VGADGPTHAGSFDIAFLSTLPNFVIMAASDEIELARMVRTSVEYNQGPISFRYPRGNCKGLDIPENYESLTIGKGRIIKEGEKIALLSLGARLSEANLAAEKLDSKGLSCTVADARFAKPLDEKMILDLVKNHEAIITIEEGSSGGFGSNVLSYLSKKGLLDDGLKIRNIYLPDQFISHGNMEEMYEEAGLKADDIVATALKMFKIKDSKLKIINP